MDISLSLIKECKAHNAQAFDQLLHRYESQLYRLCYGYTRDREETLDILQEVYIKIFRSIHTFNEDMPFYPWVKRIAINTCINYYRSRNKYQEVSLDAKIDEQQEFINKIIDTTNIEETACANDTQEIISRSIKSLPEAYRIPIVLRYTEDMSYEQIAKALNQPLGTVKSNISRGRSLLRKFLDEHKLLEV
ncbi:hypothetical protein BHU72_10595 [Desulfuribacillus stibiiarsenatis]|uniref:RNA polymerase subunit sigma-24 n=1 Tax=Desulfuribacillus stibiiarsenatis TaxID=1390249 RepID=A0A1E5L296_9FIRM|nr:sigma-70 family RNA polymerase sigma factor [Desulfuribacillus stibiiarsenatis]OEH84255.1 hypothetical protein BHU72_10595 [Desulfuribacillus stibiiarsenatis]